MSHSAAGCAAAIRSFALPTLLLSVRLKPAAARYFYEGEIKDQRCFGRSRWILGIRSPVGEGELISKTLQLVKVCSAQFVPELVKRAKVTMVVQVNGKVRARLEVPPDISMADASTEALEDAAISAVLAGATPLRIVSRPPRLVNIIV